MIFNNNNNLSKSFYNIFKNIIFIILHILSFLYDNIFYENIITLI